MKIHFSHRISLIQWSWKIEHFVTHSLSTGDYSCIKIKIKFIGMHRIPLLRKLKPFDQKQNTFSEEFQSKQRYKESKFKDVP